MIGHLNAEPVPVSYPTEEKEPYRPFKFDPNHRCIDCGKLYLSGWRCGPCTGKHIARTSTVISLNVRVETREELTELGYDAEFGELVASK